jgi:hypothetical protein
LLIPEDDDLLLRPTTVQYTMEIDNALYPHTLTLTNLLYFKPSKPLKQKAQIARSYPVVPAREFVDGTSKLLVARTQVEKDGVVPYTGDVGFEDQARVANWIHKQIPGAGSNFCSWMGKVLFAHAITLLIAFRRRSVVESFPAFPCDGSARERETFLVDEAWKHQISASRPKTQEDPNLACIVHLEEAMFEQSAAAGIAGLCQWGLDAGDHQERWDPYANLPMRLKKNNWEEPEDEIIYEVRITHLSLGKFKYDVELRKGPIILKKLRLMKNRTLLGKGLVPALLGERSQALRHSASGKYNLLRVSQTYMLRSYVTMYC